jgi:hypothetical protein
MKQLKADLKLRLKALHLMLKEKEGELRKDPGFDKSPLTLYHINEITQDITNTSTFLALTTDDPRLHDEVRQSFHEALDRLEKRIKELGLTK